MSERLYRSRQDRMLAGVAGGLAELWDADPSLVRIIWALLVIFTGGLALIVYIVMAIVVPERDAEPWPDSWPTETGVPAGTDAPAGTDSPVAPAAAARRAARAERRGSGPGTGGMIAGLILVGLGVFFLVRQWLPEIDFDWLWPLFLIILGLVLLVAALGRRDDSGGTP